MISGVIVTPLRRIQDERGCIFHMLKKEDPHFKDFGEIYFSEIYPNAIKGWHNHTKMTLNYACVVGKIKLVLYDGRPESETYQEIQEVYISDHNYSLVTVPPGVWNGFKAVGNERALVANCTTHSHDSEEIQRMDPLRSNIPYNWDLKHG
jgi:dTDP-4-dehydrorhamnose 3,5-epimerase